MADSYLEQPAGSGSNIHLNFQADYSYSLGRVLFKSEVVGRKNGQAALVSGGHSYATIRGIHGVVTSETETAEKQLWEEMDPLVEQYTSSKQITRLRLYVDDQGGYVQCDGWVQGYNADRSVIEGHVVIKITFDFVIKTKDTSNLN